MNEQERNRLPTNRNGFIWIHIKLKWKSLMPETKENQNKYANI